MLPMFLMFLFHVTDYVTKRVTDLHVSYCFKCQQNALCHTSTNQTKPLKFSDFVTFNAF